MEAYSMDLRVRVMADVDAGMGTKAAAEKYRVSPSAAHFQKKGDACRGAATAGCSIASGRLGHRATRMGCASSGVYRRERRTNERHSSWPMT